MEGDDAYKSAVADRSRLPSWYLQGERQKAANPETAKVLQMLTQYPALVPITEAFINKKIGELNAAIAKVISDDV